MRRCNSLGGSVLAGMLFSILFANTARAEVQTALEYQRTKDTAVINTVKVDCWASSQWGVRASYDFDVTGLSADLLYRENQGGMFTPYLGIGLRDIRDSSGKGLHPEQRTELLAGVEMRVTNRLALAAEARVTPLNWGKHPELEPIFGLSIKWTPWLKREPGLSIGIQATWLLAKLITAEAGNEPYEGQVAVGAVVLNRMKSPDFPQTVRQVIYQEGQFSSLPKLSKIVPSDAAIRAAREALAGNDPSHGALYFYNPEKCKPEGLRFFSSPQLEVTVQISHHIFLKPQN